jgi:hypothetical protein
MTHPIHHLECKTERCALSVRLNDVPVVELLATTQPEWFAPPINLYLIGEENLLELAVSPLPKDDGSPGDFGDVSVEGAVRVYAKGDAVAPGEGPLVLELAVMAELATRMEEAKERDEELEIPQTFVFVFDSAGPSFEAELTETDAYDDEGALRDYAILLRDAMRGGQVAALTAEMEPKVQAYAIAYDMPADMIRQSLADVLSGEYLPLGFETDFERDEVELAPAAGGRLWELRRPGGLPLVQTPPDAEGNTMQIPIVVGLRDGALRVVR